MKGASEYAELFKTGQYGRLYITSGSHARGSTFRIQLLPEDVKAIENGPVNLCINKDSVEVYGIISGQPGWTEVYGWIHKGKWVDDFNSLVAYKKEEKELADSESLTLKETKEDFEKNRIKSLLANY